MYAIKVDGFPFVLFTESGSLAEEAAAAICKGMNVDTDVWVLGTLVHEFFAESKP
jgi:hypothetical protein